MDKAPRERRNTSQNRNKVTNIKNLFERKKISLEQLTNSDIVNPISQKESATKNFEDIRAFFSGGLCKSQGSDQSVQNTLQTLTPNSQVMRPTQPKLPLCTKSKVRTIAAANNLRRAKKVKCKVGGMKGVKTKTTSADGKANDHDYIDQNNTFDSWADLSSNEIMSEGNHTLGDELGDHVMTDGGQLAHTQDCSQENLYKCKERQEATQNPTKRKAVSMDDVDATSQVISHATVVEMFQQIRDQLTKERQEDRNSLMQFKTTIMEEVAKTASEATEQVMNNHTDVDVDNINTIKQELAVYKRRTQILTEVCDRFHTEIIGHVPREWIIWN